MIHAVHAFSLSSHATAIVRAIPPLTVISTPLNHMAADSRNRIYTHGGVQHNNVCPQRTTENRTLLHNPLQCMDATLLGTPAHRYIVLMRDTRCTSSWRSAHVQASKKRNTSNFGCITRMRNTMTRITLQTK